MQMHAPCACTITISSTSRSCSATLQDSCFYKHPAEARGQPKPPPPGPPTPEQLAAKAAAWRAHNAAQQRQQQQGKAGHGSASACRRMRAGARQQIRSSSPTTVLDGTGSPQETEILPEEAACQPDLLFQAPQWGVGQSRDVAKTAMALPEAYRRGPRQRNKIRNRFRSGIFRR